MFALLPGTNRLKADEEITTAAVRDLDAVRRQLDELKAGESVIIHGRRFGGHAPAKEADSLGEYGEKIGLNIDGGPKQPAASQPEATQPSAGGDAFEVRTQKAEVKIAAEGEKTVFSVTSPTGIGNATIDRKGEAWPKGAVVRLHLGGLESLKVPCGTTTVSASISSHGDFATRLRLMKDGKEGPQLTKDSPHWMEVRAFDASGKAAKGLPEKGGYFELVIPKALLDEAKTLTLSWIDFYRG